MVGAQDSDWFLVYAKSDPKAAPHESISCFIVERALGVEVQNIYQLLGTRGGGTGRLVFKNVRGPQKMWWVNLHDAYTIFNRMMIPERLLSGAGCIGAGRAALEVAARYSTRRKAFGQTIDKFQAVNFMLADSRSRPGCSLLLGLHRGQAGGFRGGRTVAWFPRPKKWAPRRPGR